MGKRIKWNYDENVKGNGNARTVESCPKIGLHYNI